MATKWATGNYLGSITINKIEHKYTLAVTFERGGRIAAEGLYNDKIFLGTGKYAESAPYTFKAIFTDAFGFSTLYFDGFRGADDTIFGNWMESTPLEASKNSPAVPKPKRNRFQMPVNDDDDDDDDEEKKPATKEPTPVPGGSKGSFFLKFKKLSPEEIEAVNRQEAEKLKVKRERELSEGVATLESMGFSKEISMNALIARNGHVESALNDLLSGAAFSAARQAPASPAPQSQIDESLISQLTDMGFARDRSIQALEATNQNVAAAVELLFSS